jgi:hypothetical protein
MCCAYCRLFTPPRAYDIEQGETETTLCIYTTPASTTLVLGTTPKNAVLARTQYIQTHPNMVYPPALTYHPSLSFLTHTRAGKHGSGKAFYPGFALL